MKYCKNCSASLEDNAVFCPECGASLADEFTSTNESGMSYQNNVSQPPKDVNMNEGSYTSGTQYSQPNQYGASVPGAKAPGTPWIIASAIGFFFCGGIFVIPGMIYAILSNTSFYAGDIPTARKRAKIAKWLTIFAVIMGTIAYILLISYLSEY